MIQANELRIGNLFYKIDRSREVNLPIPIKILEINMFEVTACFSFENPALMPTIPVISVADLSPIPLTPEILEKCGFEIDNKTAYGGWLSPKIGGSRIRLVKEDVGFSFFNGICKTVVKYLHTLQNYYPAWASGEELIYKP